MSFSSRNGVEVSGSLGSIHRRGVGDDAHHLLAERLPLLEHADVVAVALRHLLAVEARHHRRLFEDVGVGDLEDLAELIVELGGDVAGDLDVLLLVLPHRHQVGQVDEDVGRLEHGIGEQAVIGHETLRHLVLVAGGPLKQPHGRDAGEHPGELGHLGHVLLGEEHGLRGVEAEGQVVRGHAQGQMRAAPWDPAPWSGRGSSP